MKTIKPDKSPPRLLTSNIDGVHPSPSLWKKYLQQKTHDDMLVFYKIFDLNHKCELCKLKT